MALVLGGVIFVLGGVGLVDTGVRARANNRISRVKLVGCSGGIKGWEVEGVEVCGVGVCVVGADVCGSDVCL